MKRMSKPKEISAISCIYFINSFFLKKALSNFISLNLPPGNNFILWIINFLFTKIFLYSYYRFLYAFQVSFYSKESYIHNLYYDFYLTFQRYVGVVVLYKTNPIMIYNNKFTHDLCSLLYSFNTFIFSMYFR